MSERSGLGWTMRVAVSLACVLAWCASGVALGQAGGQSLLVRDIAKLESLQIRADDPLSGPAALAELMEHRAAMISRHGSDERLSSWLADQCADEMRRLSATALDTTVLLGLPADEQRALVRASARQVMADVDRARRTARALIERADGKASLTADEEARLEQARTLDLPIRLPFFEGRAMLLAAASETRVDEFVSGSPLVEGALASLAGLTLSPGPAEVARLVSMAACHLMMGGEEAGRKAKEALASAERVRTSLEGVGLDRSIDRTTQAEIAILRTLVRPAAERPAALRAALDEPVLASKSGPEMVWRVLAFDAVARQAIADSRRVGAGPQRDRLLAEAARVQEQLLHDGLAIDESALRALVVARLSDIGAMTGNVGVLPPMAAMATLVRQASAPGADRARVAEELLALSERPEASHVRAWALWEAAVLMQPTERDDGRGDRPLARWAEVLLALALEFPGHELAPAAMSSVLPIVQTRALATGSSGDTTLYARALDGALAMEGVADEDVWRCERARLLIAEQPPAAAGLRRAIELARSVGMESEQAANARALHASAVRLWMDASLAQGKHAEAALVADEALDQMARWTSARPAEVIALRLDRAQAWLAMREPRVLRELESIAQIDASVLAAVPGDAQGMGAMERTRLMLAGALREERRPEEAFAQLRGLAMSLDADPSDAAGPRRPIAFWRAWIGMMEILLDRASNAALSREDRSATLGVMRTHLLRLWELDPGSSGSGMSERLRWIESEMDRLKASLER